MHQLVGFLLCGGFMFTPLWVSVGSSHSPKTCMLMSRKMFLFFNQIMVISFYPVFAVVSSRLLQFPVVCMNDANQSESSIQTMGDTSTLFASKATAKRFIVQQQQHRASSSNCSATSEGKTKTSVGLTLRT